ncbi:MAG: DUF615 domain-containing protein [Gammaproteobacteria bacterium]|nr:DUF615 domain-containing protein [Gammaproteobacteria bacterium]
MEKNYIYEDEEYTHSRSALKREADRLQALGEALLELPDSSLKEVELPEVLADAIEVAKKINSRSGYKRQRQYIGKLMRHIDPEPIEKFLQQLKDHQGEANAHHHQLEKWRDQLIVGDNALLTELIEQYPTINAQQLRQLIRNAQKEKQQEKPPKYYRELFKFLRESSE